MKSIDLEKVLSNKFTDDKTIEEVKALLIEETNSLLKEYPDAYFMNEFNEKESISSVMPLIDFYSSAHGKNDEECFADIIREKVEDKMSKIVMSAIKEAIADEGIVEEDFNAEINGKQYMMHVMPDGNVYMYKNINDEQCLTDIDLWEVLDPSINYSKDGSTASYGELWFPNNFLKIADMEDWNIDKVEQFK